MTRPGAILLSLTDDTVEMEELAYSLGYTLVDVVVQRRGRPDPVGFLGSGKLEEARARLSQTDARLVIVNGDLKPSQIFALQTFFQQPPTPAALEALGPPSARLNADGAPDAAEPIGEDTRAWAPAEAESTGGDDDSPWSVAAARRARLRQREGDAVEVYDRVRVILEIFHERARSPEARLQVELAKLTYETPLVREAINRAKRGERQGRFFGGGEYEVNYYYDMMKRRMTRIRRELDRISRERDVRRKHRRRSGFHLVSLAGYTNAGKSSLLRALAGSRNTLVENRYFSTLSTQTRRVEDARREILLTDTVGFVEKLPPWVVDAFHSTLEEIALSDVILLVVDASDPLPELVRKVRTSTAILHEFDAPSGSVAEGMSGGSRSSAARGRRSAGERGGGRRRGRAGGSVPDSGPVGAWGRAPVLLVLNKADLLSADELTQREAFLEREGLVPGRPLAVSARTGDGLASLLEAIHAALPTYDVFEVRLPASAETEALLSWLMTSTDVTDVRRAQDVRARCEAKPALRQEIEARVKQAGGAIVADASLSA